MRIFMAPTDIWRRLSLGCPRLHDEIALAMTATGEDPEVEVHRHAPTTAPASWTIVVQAGLHRRELALDVRVEEAAAAAIAVLLVDLVADLRRELPSVFERPEVVRGTEQFVPWPWARTKPSGGAS